MNTIEILDTKVTTINGMYCCRILKDDKPILETRVANRTEISSAIKEMLRTLDKLGYDSPMASASRHRCNNMPVNRSKFIWHPV